MTVRERSRNNDGPLLTWNKSEMWQAAGHDQGPPTYQHTQGTFQGVTNNETMTDVVTPGFERISGNGGIVNSPMTHVQTILRDNLSNFSYYYGWEQVCNTCNPVGWHPYENAWTGKFPSTNWCSWADLLDVPSMDEQTMIDLAVTKAWAKIDTSEVQSLVMLGESEKTVVSLVSIFNRLIKVIKSAKKADIRYLKRQMSKKELSERYMELRYALRPLMYDIKGCTAALQTQASQTPIRQTFRGIQTYSDEDEATSSSTSTMNNVIGEWKRDRVYHDIAELEIEVRAGVLVEIAALNKLHIWGMLQPIEAVWELVPFSFIIDWFFNVGKTIASFTPNFGSRALASWYVQTKRTYQFRGCSFENGRCVEANPATHKCLGFNYSTSGMWIDKTVITKTRVPSPSRSITPHFDVRLDTFKLADLLIIGQKLWLRTA